MGKAPFKKVNKIKGIERSFEHEALSFLISEFILPEMIIYVEIKNASR